MEAEFFGGLTLTPPGIEVLDGRELDVVSLGPTHHPL